MVMTRNEFWIVAFIAVIVSATLTMVIVNYSTMRDGNDFHRNVIERLESIEHMRTKATAKRFTSDHYLELSQCLRIPYAGRERCLKDIDAKFKEQQQ